MKEPTARLVYTHWAQPSELPWEQRNDSEGKLPRALCWGKLVWTGREQRWGERQDEKWERRLLYQSWVRAGWIPTQPSLPSGMADWPNPTPAWSPPPHLYQLPTKHRDQGPYKERAHRVYGPRGGLQQEAEGSQLEPQHETWSAHGMAQGLDTWKTGLRDTLPPARPTRNQTSEPMGGSLIQTLKEEASQVSAALRWTEKIRLITNYTTSQISLWL